MEQNKLFCCKDCRKSYSNRSNLNIHIKRIHPEKISTLNLKAASIFKCLTCEKEYSSKQKLRHHGSRVNHPAIDEFSEATKTTYSCILCQLTVGKISLLMNHIESSHNIKIEKETLKFNTFEEFKIWKDDMEQATKASFVIRRSYFSLNCVTRIFQCNRSGFYVSKSTGQRHIKAQGSNKINTHCPAVIKLRQKGDECEVEYTKTHFGHENSLRNLSLRKTDKEQIVDKLVAKIPFKVILDEIKGNADATNVKRIDLVTRKDLYNIQKTYNLRSTNNKIDQETTLPTDSNTENMQEESSTDENKQKSILLTCESRVNKRRLSGDSDYAVAKRKLDILFENIMSCCTTTAQLKVLTDTLQSVKPKILALGRGLKECIQVNEIKGKKILMPQRRFIILNNKRLVPLKVVEHSEILKKNG